MPWASHALLPSEPRTSTRHQNPTEAPAPAQPLSPRHAFRRPAGPAAPLRLSGEQSAVAAVGPRWEGCPVGRSGLHVGVPELSPPPSPWSSQTLPLLWKAHAQGSQITACLLRPIQRTGRAVQGQPGALLCARRSLPSSTAVAP